MSEKSKKSRCVKSAASQRSHKNSKSALTKAHNKTKQSIEVKQKILHAAEEWLIKKGYHTFSMRNIANECNISVGNLAYHFPKKELLINALLDKLISFYLKGCSLSFLKQQSQKEPGIEGLMNWLLKDAAKNRTARLNRELWMLSSHFPEVRKKFNYVYDVLISNVVELLSQKYPHLTQQKLDAIGSFIAIITEGTCIIYGGRYKGTIPFAEFNSAAVKILREYINS